MAIIKATRAIEKLTTKVEWHFYCDNQGAVKTLDNPEVNTKLVWDCSKALTELGTRSKVTLHWVKAHVGHHGNERADTLAKKRYHTNGAGNDSGSKIILKSHTE